MLLAAAAAYAPTLPYGLVWDDAAIAGNVAAVVRERGVAGLAAAEFRLEPEGGRSLGYYRPVVLLSFHLDALLTRAGLRSYHLTNVALHAANAALVCLLLGALGTGAGALFGGLLFALHPVHVESVAFVSGRTDLWASLFTLAGALAWARGRRDAAGAGRTQQLAGGLCLLLGLLSKESAFPLPAVLLAWDAAGAPARRPRGGWVARNGAWLAAWGAALAVALALRLLVAGVGFGAREGGTWLEEAKAEPLLGLRIALAYLRLLAVPWPLSAFYAPADLGVTAATLAGAAATLCLLALAARVAGPRAGLLGPIWIAGFLLPVSGLVPLGGAAAAERFLYLPSVGLCLAAATVAGALARSGRLRAPAAAAGTLLLAAALLGTVARSRVWRDDLALHRDVARTSPRSADPRLNLGKALLERGRPGPALEAYEAAVRLAPERGETHSGVGEALLALGRPEDAARAFREAIRLEPGGARHRYNLGLALLALGRPEDAVRENLRALELEPRFPLAANNLGVAYSRLGRHGEAAEAFRKSAEQDPSCAGCFFNLGLEQAALGRWPEAAGAFAEALRIDPGHPGARAQLDRARHMPGGR